MSWFYWSFSGLNGMIHALPPVCPPYASQCDRSGAAMPAAAPGRASGSRWSRLPGGYCSSGCDQSALFRLVSFIDNGRSDTLGKNAEKFRFSRFFPPIITHLVCSQARVRFHVWVSVNLGPSNIQPGPRRSSPVPPSLRRACPLIGPHGQAAASDWRKMRASLLKPTDRLI